MGKFTAIQTYDRFLKLWEQHKVNDHSLNFILDTGQLYTHGIFLNSVAYGAEADGAVQLTIAGTQKILSLSKHTHSTYLEKNADINLGAYKIVSGEKDLLYYSGGNTYLGNTTSPAVILGTSLSTVRNNSTYTILDTGNFSILNITNNSALFTYNKSSFLLDYIKRLNTSSTFDTLATYTSAGTTQLNNKLYGFITLYTDGVIQNPSWTQFRVDITDLLVQFRTSKDSTKWINLLNKETLPVNALNVAGIVTAPTSSTSNKVWKTDTSGNPDWRDGTTAVISNSSTGTTNITTDQNNPYYNLIEGSAVTRSILFKGGLGISINSNNGVITFNSADNTISSTLSNINLISLWSNVEDLTTKLGNNDGSYIILIIYGSRIYTGYFSYVSDSSGIEEEILLHCSGKVESSPLERGRLYAKIGLNGSKVYLQLATTLDENNATVTIKYKKVL